MAQHTFPGDLEESLPSAMTPTPHHTTHETGGSDPVSGIALGAHHTTHEPSGSDPLTVDAIAATGSLRTLGTGSTQACPGNDSRLSDARTPTVHGSGYHTGTIGTWSQIDKTVADLGDITTKKHSSLTEIGTKTHSEIDTHIGAAAPHSGHELTSSKNGANGYCGLDSTTKVPTDKLAGTGADNSKYLRGDRLWATPTWNEINKTVSNLGDLTTKSHYSLTDIGSKTHSDIDNLFTRLAAISDTPGGAGLKLSNFINLRVPSTGSYYLVIDTSPDGTNWTERIGITGSGSIYIPDNCSALSFTDRTPFFEGDALEAIKGITGKDGQIDHDTIPIFAQKKITVSTVFNKATGKETSITPYEEIGRDIGGMVSIQTVALQQLITKQEALESQLQELIDKIKTLETK